MYSFPGRSHPGYVVGRFEINALSRHMQGIAFLLTAGLLFAAYTFFTGPSSASTSTNPAAVSSTIEDEMVKTSREMDKKTEEMKQKILSMDDEESTSTKSFYHYKVKKGDTLGSISKALGIRADQIAASSNLKHYDVLKPGQKLVIPEKKGVVYTIKKGDVIAKVAQYYSVSVEDIQASNSENLDLDMPEDGTIIFLPNARVPVVNRTWILPAYGRLTSRFGRRRHPFHRYYQKHTGIDIGSKYGTVKAARTGQVIFAGRLGNYGNAVIIKHPGGYKTLYAHLSRIYVKKGSSIRQGKRIGRSGNTGMSTGPHLHFEIIKNGRPVNPLRYVRY